MLLELQEQIKKLQKQVRCLACSIAPSSINLGAASEPDTSQTNTIQYNDSGDIWFVDENGNAIPLGSEFDSITTNGFVKTTGGDGTIVIDTNLYLSTAAPFALLGGSIKAEPIGISINNVTTTNAGIVADATLMLVAVYLPLDTTITGVKWYQATQGNYTADAYNGVGLYTYSGGTLTLVASSTNDGNIWKATGNTWANKAFSSTYPAVAGVYFIGALYNQSAQVAAPTMGAFPSTISGAVQSGDFTNSAKLFSSLAAQASLPASQASSGLTAATIRTYFALY